MKVEFSFSPQVMEEQHLKSLTSSMNTMQHVLEEAGRLLKLVWRVSLPAGCTVGDSSADQQVNMHKHIYQTESIQLSIAGNQILIF